MSKTGASLIKATREAVDMAKIMVKNKALHTDLKATRKALYLIRSWFLWHKVFAQGKTMAECEPCDPLEVIKKALDREGVKNE